VRQTKGIVTIIAFFVFGARLLAQEARLDVDSDHSTARLVLSSSQTPAVQVNVAVARVSGIVTGTADLSDPSLFDLTIYPADTPDPRSEDRTDSRSNAQNTLFTFKSRSVREDGTTLEATGELTVTYVERVATYSPSESYSGPTYGPPIAHSEKREVTFEFQQIREGGASAQSASGAEWSASGLLQDASFPELLRAVEITSWPVLVEDAHCEMPLTTGEDYSGPKCTGTLVGVTARTDVHCEMPPTTGEDFSGEICTGTPLFTYPTDTDHIRLANQSTGPLAQLVANQVTIDLDLRLTTASRNGAETAGVSTR
jgi:hypothetical protein